MRRRKVIKIDFMNNQAHKEAFLAMFDSPDELRLGVGANTFLSIRDGIVSLSGGTPSQFNVQGLSLTYAGMLQDVSFPFSLIPPTIATPIPPQTIKPPFLELIPAIQQYAMAAAMMAVRR